MAAPERRGAWLTIGWFASRGPTAETGGTPGNVSKRWIVFEVRNAIQRGDTFHTVGVRGVKAYIEAYDAPTLRTRPEATTIDNLESLGSC